MARRTRPASRLGHVVDSIGPRLDAQELESDGFASRDRSRDPEHQTAVRLRPMFLDDRAAHFAAPSSREPAQLGQVFRLSAIGRETRRRTFELVPQTGNHRGRELLDKNCCLGAESAPATVSM